MTTIMTHMLQAVLSSSLEPGGTNHVMHQILMESILMERMLPMLMESTGKHLKGITSH